MEFFRSCPACARRFHLKLVEKKRTRLERETVRKTRPIPVGSTAGRGGPYGGGNYPITMLYEGEPIVIDVEEFQYTYKCGHCGHEWFEKRIKEHKEW